MNISLNYCEWVKSVIKRLPDTLFLTEKWRLDRLKTLINKISARSLVLLIFATWWWYHFFCLVFNSLKLFYMSDNTLTALLLTSFIHPFVFVRCYIHCVQKKTPTFVFLLRKNNQFEWKCQTNYFYAFHLLLYLRFLFKLVTFSESYARKYKWVFFSEHSVY